MTTCCYNMSAAAGDLMTMHDISVIESEDLPKVLEPLVEAGPQAALGKPTQKGNSQEADKKQLLQTVKLAAPGIVKLQASPGCLYRLCLHGKRGLTWQLLYTGTSRADERQTG